MDEKKYFISISVFDLRSEKSSAAGYTLICNTSDFPDTKDVVYFFKNKLIEFGEEKHIT